EIGIAYERADAHPAIGQLLDPVETGKMSDVDESVRCGHAALHKVEKVCAGREISGAGRSAGDDGITDRRWPDIVEPLHAPSLRLAASIARCACSTAPVIP